MLSLPVKELGSSMPCFQIMATSHMPGKSLFCSYMEGWFDKLIWLGILFSSPCPQPTPPPPPVAAVSCFPSLVHYATWSYRLLGQGRASGPGSPSCCSTASCACWGSCQGTAAKEKRSVSPGGRSISSHGRSKHLSCFLQGVS